MMLLKIDTRDMDDEKFIRIIRLLGLYCTRGILSGFEVDNTIDYIYLHYNLSKQPKAISIYEMSKALGVSIIVVAL